MDSTAPISGAFSHANDSLIMLDEQLRILGGNERLFFSLGCDECEVVGDFLPGCQSIQDKRELAKLVEQGLSPTGLACCFSHITGRICRCRIFLVPLLEEREGLHTFLGIVQFEAGKETFERVEVSELKLRSIVRLIGEPVLMTTGVRHTLFDSNKGFEILTSWRRSDLMGKDLSFLFRDGKAYENFLLQQKRRSLVSNIHLGRWQFKRKESYPIVCAVLAFDFFRLESQVPVTLYLLINRNDDELRSIKLARLAAEYSDLVKSFEFCDGNPVVDFSEGGDQPLDLSPRQKDVVVLAAQGLSAKEIGATLGLAEVTVRNHFSMLYRKFQVPSRIALLNTLHELGLFPH